MSNDETVEFVRRCACGNPDALWAETPTMAGPTAIRITCDHCEPIHNPIIPIPLRNPNGLPLL